MHVYATDNAGNNGFVAGKVINVLQDTTAPSGGTVSIPASVYGPVFNMTVSGIIDTQSGLASVSFAVWSQSNQGDLKWISGINSNGTWTASVNMANFSNHYDIYNVHVYAADNAGNSGLIGAKKVNVLCDTIPPASGIINAPDTVYMPVFDISESGITDAQTGVASVKFAIWSKSNQSDMKWLQAINNNGTWTVTMNLAEFNNNYASYTVHVYATDNVGNMGFVGGKAINVVQDTTPPSSGSISLPDTLYGSVFSIGISGVTDSQSGIDTVSFAVWTKSDQSDMKWLQGTNENGIWTAILDIADFNNSYGIYTIHAYATDKAGNKVYVGGKLMTISTIGAVNITSNNNNVKITVDNVKNPAGVDSVILNVNVHNQSGQQIQLDPIRLTDQGNNKREVIFNPVSTVGGSIVSVDIKLIVNDQLGNRSNMGSFNIVV